MAPFGCSLMVTDLISNFYNKIPQFFLGKLYSPAVLGSFDQAVKLKDMPAATGIQAVQNVTFPALAKIRDDAPRFAEGYRQVVMVVSYVMFPIMLGMSAVARDMFAVLLGEEWMPTVPYFEAVCLAGLFSPIALTAYNVLKARCKGPLIVRLEVVKKIIMTAIFAVTIPHSVMAVVWGLVAIAFCEMAVNFRGTGDMAETASVVLHLAARVTPFDACPEFFPDVLALVNDKEVSDHHAILPTLELEKANVPGLPVGERNILLLVCCKLLCAAAEPFVYEAVTATFDCGGHTFTAKGKQVLSQGWRAIQEVFRSSLKEKPEDEDAEGVLPALTEGQVFEPVSASVTEHFTSPPKPYTEDTLLSAMENAGKEDMPDEAERKGLGTPATRAAIIEKLVSGGFVERKGKNLIPTKAGVNLVTVLPELLTSPKLTADWEQRLNEVAKGQASPEDFMDGIEAMAAELVRKYSHISEDGQKLFQPEKETVGLCPRCGKPVYEGKKNFACSDRACQFVMWKNDRFWTSRRKEMTRKMAADLLKKGHTSVKGMWSEKKGSTYDAVVILDDTGGKYVNFKLEFPKRKDGVHGKK